MERSGERTSHVIDGRYELLRVLGEGSMGATYLARDSMFERHLSLKVLARQTPERIELFRREFMLLRGRAHENLVRVFDFGRSRESHLNGQTLHYFTSAYVEGLSLIDYAKRRPASALRCPVIGVLRALSFLHSCGIRHGDVKPDNVLVDGAGRATLIDLSCAERLGRKSASTLSGTLEYLAPEQLDGSEVDQRADLHSLGLSLGRCLSAADEDDEELRLIAAWLSHRDRNRRPSSAADALERLGEPHPHFRSSAAIAGNFVGRSRECNLANHFVSAIVSGQTGPRVLRITGPSGVGRTRLYEEIKWQAQLSLRTFEARPSEPGPVATLLRRAMGLSELKSDLASVVETRERLVATRATREGMLLCVDDADRLAESERDLFYALLRNATEEDAVGILYTATDASFGQTLSALTLELGPLSLEDVRNWLDGVLPSRLHASVWKATGGFPLEIENILTSYSNIALGETALTVPASRDALRQERARLFKSLPEALKDALLRFAISDALATTPASVLSISDDVQAQLVERGWLRLEDGVCRLNRSTDASRIASTLDARAYAEVCKAMATSEKRIPQMDGGEGIECHGRARLCYFLTLAGDVAEAETIFGGESDSSLDSSTDWLTATQSLAMRSSKANLLARAAALHESQGRAKEALDIVVRCLKLRPSAEIRAGAALISARAYSKLGQLRRAVPRLKRAFESSEGAARARAAAELSLTLSKLGDHAAALAVAETGLQARAEIDDATAAHLHFDAGVACAYLGRLEPARDHLDSGTALANPELDAECAVRASSARALIEYRAGSMATALSGYEAAFSTAVSANLPQYMAVTALNLGVACHQTGEWAKAEHLYRASASYGRALGRAHTVATSEMNLARLFLDLGDWERTLEIARNAASRAQSLDMKFMHAAAIAVEAETLLWQGRTADGIATLLRAKEEFVDEGAKREVAEADLQMALHAMRRSETDVASTHLESVRLLIEDLGAKDLNTRHELLAGSLRFLRGEVDEAAAIVRALVAAPHVTDQPQLLAQTHELAFRVYQRKGAHVLADRHRVEALSIWERIAASLTTRNAELFWNHPVRSALRQEIVIRHDSPLHETRWRKLVDINKQLNSSLSTRDVLKTAIDAAIELTEAERGFVVLRGPKPDWWNDESSGGQTSSRTKRAKASDFFVAVARNWAQEQVSKAHLEFSRSITETVLEQNEPLITVDATTDERFSNNRSVHAMKLKSVICVPVTTAREVIGAVYLDNRLSRHRFDSSNTELLLAFADQVGIALGNAKMHDALTNLTNALKIERDRVAELASGQAETIERLEERIELQQRTLFDRYEESGIVGRSEGMQRLFAIVDRVSQSPVTVLIQGESGTGKELFAKALHFRSARREQPFVAINCSALPESLLEAELFGYVKGAFSGAVRDHEGLFASARGGTLFLDELGEMTPSMQVKLLRVLQEREVRPLGANKTQPVDVRVVCATNRDLKSDVERGSFREDLYYRIAVVELVLPPLRDRVDDIPLLASHLVARICQDMGRSAFPVIRTDAMAKLASYDWPGNVRQLHNVLTKAILFAEQEISARDVTIDADAGRRAVDATHRDADEYRVIVEALRKSRWKVVHAAAELGMPRATFYRKLKRYGLTRTRR